MGSEREDLRYYGNYCVDHPQLKSAILLAEHALSAQEEQIEQLRRGLLAIAAGCHRAKWSYEDTLAPIGTPTVFDFLHRLGDQAKDAAALEGSKR